MSTIVRVSDIMTDHFTLVEGKDTLSNGLDFMKKNKSRIMIINKRHDDDEYGLVCINDIAKKVLAADKNPERINLYEIMTKPIITIRHSMDIRYCTRLMSRLGMTLAPVCDDTGTIIGIVGYDDIIFKGLMPND